MVTWDSKALKATPLAADEILIIDTADSRNQKRATLTSIGATHWSRNTGSGFIFPSTLTDKVGIGLNNPSEIFDVLGNIKYSGVIKAPNGTELLPSYSFTSSPSSGMRFATGILSFSEGGFDVLQLTSDALAENFLTINSGADAFGTGKVTMTVNSAVSTDRGLDIVTSGEVNIATGASGQIVIIGKNDVGFFNANGAVGLGSRFNSSNVLSTDGLVLTTKSDPDIFTLTKTRIESPNASTIFDTKVQNEVTTGAVALTVDDTNTFSRTTGSFITDGFVAGQLIVSSGFTNSQNNGTFIVATVAALTLDITTTTLTPEVANTREITELNTGDVTFVTTNQDIIFSSSSAEKVNVGIGVKPSGTLHARSSDAGTLTLNADADELVLENSGNTGYTTAPTVVISAPETPVTATATSTITGDAVTSVTVTSGGQGYAATPTVSFSGGGGTGAAATAVLVNTSVTVITVTAGGTGYSSAPTVTLTAAPAPVTATGTANISGGKVTSVTITTGGIGYKVPPALVQFIGGDGNGVGTDSVSVANSAITSITVTAGGTGLSIVSASDHVGVISFTHGGATDQQASIVQDHSTERMRFLQSGQQGLIIDGLGHVAVSQDNEDHANVFTVDTDVLNVPVRILVRDSLDRLMLGYNGSDIFKLTATEAQVIVPTDTGDLAIASRGNLASNIKFYTSAGSTLVERMRILTGGNVGIGIADPDSKLEVLDKIKISGALPALELDGNFTTAIRLREADVTTDNRRWRTFVDNAIMTHSITNDAESVVTDYMKLTRSGTTMTSVAFTTNSLTTSGNFTVDTDTLFVDATNNRVGIGTITPAVHLDIAGSVGASGSVRSQITNTNSAGFADKFLFNNSGKFVGFQLGGSTIPGDFITGVPNANIAKLVASSDNFVIGNSQNAPVQFITNNLERMRITSAGVVQISNSLDMTTGLINNVLDPVSAQDAATKNYVDTTVPQTLKWKEPVRLTTTVNGILVSGFNTGDTVDGVVLATGDRILIKNQTTASENGIYVVQVSGAPPRAADFDGNTEVSGAVVHIIEGATNIGQFWKLNNTGAITVGTTALKFVHSHDSKNLIHIYNTNDWGVLALAPDGNMRVPLLPATTYRIHTSNNLPLLLMPVVPTADDFNIIDFEFVNSSINLNCDSTTTAQIWGRNNGGLLCKEGNFVDTSGEGGEASTLFDLVGVDKNALLAMQFTFIGFFKLLGHTVNMFHDHTDSLFSDNTAGFVVRNTSAVNSDNLIRAVTFRHDSTSNTPTKPVYSILGTPNSNQFGAGTLDLRAGQDFLYLDSALVSETEIVGNPYSGAAKGNFFQAAKVKSITAQTQADIAIASFETGGAGKTKMVFAAIQDFIIGQVVLIADEAAYNGLQTITAVDDDQKKFTFDVTFSTSGAGTLKMVQHTVATPNPYVRDATVVVTGTTSYNATLKILRETDTTFHLPQAFVANDATGSVTTNPLNEDTVGVKTLSNGAQKDSAAIGSFKVSGNSTATVISTINVWVDLNLNASAVTTTSTSRHTLTNTTTGEMRYDDKNQKHGKVLASISATSSGGSQKFQFRVVVNGSPISDGITASVEIGSNTIAVPLMVPTTINQNDLERIQVRNVDGTSNIVIEDITRVE